MVQKTSVSAVETARRGLCQLIATGELAAGAPLPSEAELCERFGVSRSSLREAQRMLAVAGARMYAYKIVETAGRFKEEDGGVWTAREIEGAWDAIVKG